MKEEIENYTKLVNRIQGTVSFNNQPLNLSDDEARLLSLMATYNFNFKSVARKIKVTEYHLRRYISSSDGLSMAVRQYVKEDLLNLDILSLKIAQCIHVEVSDIVNINEEGISELVENWRDYAYAIQELTPMSDGGYKVKLYSRDELQKLATNVGVMLHNQQAQVQQLQTSKELKQVN